MSRAPRKHFSRVVSVFHGRRLPEPARLAGYAHLIDVYDLKVPLPGTLSAIATRHKTILKDGWRLLTPRHEPEATLDSHLTFALKHEGLDLAVLKRLFLVVDADEIAALVRASPTGGYARRVWFLYEWLLGQRLDLPDARSGAYVPVVDPKLQWPGHPVTSTRHRVKNNLAGTPEFCPLVFRTVALDRFVAMNLAERARAVVARVPKEILTRAAAFLLLKDSRSSFVIEGEDPPQDRVQRWGRAIGEAGLLVFNADELLRLQRIVIGDARFVHLGLRREGGFVGEHDHHTGAPLPDHIDARPEDLALLLDGLAAFDGGAAQDLDPVIAAAILAFGFVYIHPFEEGNGRIHRYLIHHVLARRGFNPPGVVLPVSAAILDGVDQYKRVLESYSTRLLPVVRWQPTETGNVTVLDDTGDFYRFFDATPHAEFLYQCVLRTIAEDLPDEAAFLRRYDRFRARIEALVDMPANAVDLLFRILRQNGGQLSKRARQREFARLTQAEVREVEEAYADTIAG